MAELIATSSVLFRGTLSAQGHAEKCFLISLKLFSPRVKTSPERVFASRNYESERGPNFGTFPKLSHNNKAPLKPTKREETKIHVRSNHVALRPKTKL